MRIEVVGNAGTAAGADVGTADTVAATEWQPFFTTSVLSLAFAASRVERASDQEEICTNKKPRSRELDLCMKELILWWDPN